MSWSRCSKRSSAGVVGEPLGGAGVSVLSWTLLLIAVLVLGILIYLLLLVVKARKEASAAIEQAEPPVEPPEPPPDEAESGRASSFLLRSSFKRGLDRLRELVPARGYRYEIPWFLMIGQAGSRRPDLLAEAGLSLPVGAPDGDRESQLGCTWWFFDRGVVLDLSSEYVLRADGTTADDRGWRTLLRLLEGARPQRPIDGVVLTVPCHQLYGVNRDSPQAVAEVERKATALYDRVWQAQKRLGIRFPIYVVVTGCQLVPGFTALAEAIPEEHRLGIFGWSSPHAMDSPFRPAWADEAFDAMRYRLELAQLEVFAQSSVQKPDQVFAVSGEIASMGGAVKVFLNQLFQPSAYHESMLFRGLYFCADRQRASDNEAHESTLSEAFDLPDATAAEGRAGRGSWFLRDLFERKIFPEHKLAAPTASVFGSRNRRVRSAQLLVAAAAVVLSVGLWLGFSDLHSREDGLRVFLEDTSGALAQLKNDAETPIWQEEVEQFAATLVDDIARLDGRSYRSLFLPASWLGDVSRDLETAFVDAYNRVILKALSLELEHQTTAATTLDTFRARPRSAAPMMGTAPAAPAISSLSSFLELEQFAQTLEQLAHAGDIFNGLAENPDLKRFAEVYQFLFDHRLPAPFLEHSELYRDALSRLEYGVHFDGFEPALYRQQATAKMTGLVGEFYEELYGRGVLTETLKSLEGELRRLESWVLDDELRVFADIVELANRSELLLSQPALRWAFGEQFSLGPAYEGLMARLARSVFLSTPSRQLSSEDVVAEQRRAGEVRWILHQRELAALGSRVSGNLLDSSEDRPLMQLSPDVLFLKTALNDFLRQDFMVFDEAQRLAVNIPVGERLRWETTLLVQAAELYQPYQNFRDQSLARFPARFRFTLDRVARTQVASGIIDLINQASKTALARQGGGSLILAQELAEEVGQFRAAAEPLARILKTFQRLELRDQRRELSAVVVEQGLDLLQAVDDLLEAEELYVPGGGTFGWWDGGSPASFGAFDVSDPNELAEYLDLQRQRVNGLARDYAQPLVETLESLGALPRAGAYPVLARWEALVEQLHGYESAKPGNSLAALESFVTGELSEVNLSNCFQRVPPGSRVSGSTNFFQERQNALRSGLYQQCWKKGGELAVASYAEIESFFRRRLSGRYPFAESIADDFPVEVGAETLRQFFRLYDRLLGDICAIDSSDPEAPLAAGSFDPAEVCGATASPAFGGRGAEVVAFLRELAAVRQFLGGFLSPDSQLAAPAYAFEVQFRVNRDREQGGDQIVRWALEVGDQQIEHPPTEPTGLWTVGVPVRLTLRWATGAPEHPAKELQPFETEAVGDAVVISHGNLWSLVSFIRDHPPADGDLRFARDPRPHTLAFRIPTRHRRQLDTGEKHGRKRRKAREQGSETGDQLGEARVFIRVSLFAPESESPLLLPSFPKQAPALSLPSLDGSSKRASR